MRRRFGRGRRGRGGSDARSAPIDAGAVFARMLETGAIAARELAPLADEETGSRLAAVAVGESEEGLPLVVGFAPRNGGDAALAAIACARERGGEEGFEGEVVAVAPQWTIAARRRLGLIGELPFRFRALVAPALADGDAAVRIEDDAVDVRPPAQVVAGTADAGARALLRRALDVFEGLAAKHGGAVRAHGGAVELVVLARRAAAVQCADGGVSLTTFAPDRSTAALTPEALASEMDRLEGSLRKRLNDRRARSGEEGLRAGLIGALAEAAELRAAVAWPLGGSDPEVLDVAGVTQDGVAALGVIRAALGLDDLGAILDAALTLRPALAGLLTGPGAPSWSGELRLLLAAERVEEPVARVLPLLTLRHAVYEVAQPRGREPTLALQGAEPGAAPRARPAERPAEPPAERLEARGEDDAGRREPAEPRRERSRRSRGGRRDDRRPRAESSDAPGFEEVSVFDLDSEDSGGDGEGGARRRRRGRGRRRGRRTRPSGGAERDDSPTTSEAPVRESDEDEETDADEDRAGRSRRPAGARGRRRRERRPAAGEEIEADLLSTDDVVEMPETLAPLADDAPEIEEAEIDLGYEEDEEGAGEETPSPDEDRIRREREARRRARVAKASPEPAAPPEPKPRRRRAAVVAHADRASVLAALLLARDIRTIEGFWVYPQEELMTFFRSVATDLREEAPIYLVGFTAYPARDVLQAASLYRGRLEWFDHHDWPPEDLESLRGAIGAENVHVQPGAGSSMPAVLAGRTRRSRFSDKLVELASGRFTLHDYERWGRLWWHRLGEVAVHSGPRRADVEPLLVGRPSDLAREASRAATPPPPPEVGFVSGRDFRLVHFGGYALVVVPTPPDLDPLLASRIARERFSAQVSVAHVEATELVLLGGEEGRGRRQLDLVGMVDHLVSKHEWIESLPDDDHVPRLRVRGLTSHPERLDEVIGEIAMGRSILEG